MNDNGCWKIGGKEKMEMMEKNYSNGPQLCMLYFSAGHGIKNGTNVGNPPYVLKGIPTTRGFA